MSLRRNFELTAVLVLVGATTVAADPVRITAGSVVYTHSVDIPVTLSGDGFTFTGTTDVVEGLFTPRDQCGVPVCVPGSTVNLHSLWLGLAFHSATATYLGETFMHVGSLSSTSSMLTEFTGTLPIPSTFTGGTLTAPVALAGEFVFFNDTTFTTTHVPLFGSGTATLDFSPSVPFPGSFNLNALRFDLGDAASATPEPASMLLVATGVGALAATRRRRRTAR